MDGGALLTFSLGAALGGGAGVFLWARAGRRAALAEARLEGERATAAERLEAERRAGAERAEAERRAAEGRAESERRHFGERLEAERAAAAEKLAIVDDARTRLTDAFKALSADALRETTTSFLSLARASLEKYQEGARSDLDKRERAISELLSPVKDTLGKLDGQIREIEKAREGAYGKLAEQLRTVAEAQGQLRAEASNLVKALRAPHVRGRWGELQLRRVVELAGMVDHCDFHEQASVEAEGGRLRPDLVVHLPGGRDVVVDAKAPLAAYLDAAEAKDEASRVRLLAEHARQLREHVLALSRKAYWEQFQSTPEFVVLFLPGESFYAAALEADPGLLEAGAERRVILATPTTLIALLKAAAYGWQREAVAENAEHVAALGRDLYKRIGDLGSHFARVGKSLAQSVEAYNRTVASLEARVLPAARRFEELRAAPEGAELPELAPVEALPRPATAPELASAEPLGALTDRRRTGAP
ncbi:MAG TPA: DNA recombination protein RmuC [Anaeromyxobacter sp.]|nr:DNA recombination protein RmuC [Anaeromyxobacter sp.]